MIFSNLVPTILMILAVNCIASPLVDVTTENPYHIALRELMEVIPKDKILQIANDHLETDEAFQAAVAYLQSEEWKTLIDTIKEKPEWKEFNQLIQEIFGVDLEVMSKCNERFLKEAKVPLSLNSGVKRSMKYFLRDVQEVLPMTKMTNVLMERIINTGLYKRQLEVVKSDRFRKAFENLIAVPEVKKMVKELQEMDVISVELFNLAFT